MLSLSVLSCDPDDDPVVQEEPAPTSISATPASSSLESSGGEVALSVTAPQRPAVSGAPSWITVVDGTYNKYNITFTLRVAKNETYEPRAFGNFLDHVRKSLTISDCLPSSCPKTRGTGKAGRS